MIGSRIEVFLQLAKKELVDNYQQKKYLMIGEMKPKWLSILAKILLCGKLSETAYEGGKYH